MHLLTRFLPDSVKPYAGRIAMTIFGFIIAILFLTIGFWRTMLILVLSVLGYLLGKWEDGALDTSRLPVPRRFK